MRQGKPCEPGYHLPETAHEQLQHLHGQLRLRAALSQPDQTHPPDLILPRPALANCLGELADTAHGILAAADWRKS